MVSIKKVSQDCIWLSVKDGGWYCRYLKAYLNQMARPCDASNCEVKRNRHVSAMSGRRRAYEEKLMESVKKPTTDTPVPY
jgi:hypothetical protein